MKEFEITVDWFKYLKKKIKWLELLLLINTAAIFGFATSFEGGMYFGSVLFMVLLAVTLFSLRELYQWWTLKRALYASYKVKEAILKGINIPKED